MPVYRHESSVTVPRPRPEVFPFFADAANLERLTPPWLRFEILTPRPIEMREGALIDYRLRVRGVPVRWRSRIAAWEPPGYFADEQVEGPYRSWFHEHELETAEDGAATRVRDRVRYEVPGGPLAPLVHRLLVRRDVEKIFAYRRKRLREIFGSEAFGDP